MSGIFSRQFLEPDRADIARVRAALALASLPNYFRPWAALEATGYGALEYFGQRADGRGFVILVAPF